MSRASRRPREREDEPEARRERAKVLGPSAFEPAAPGSSEAGDLESEQPGPLAGPPPVRRHPAAARRALIGIVAVLAFSIWIMRDITLLVGYSVMLAYLLLPVVRLIEQVQVRGRSLPRVAAAGLVMLALVSVVVWVVVTGVPRLVSELAAFATTLPEKVNRLVEGLRAYSISHGLGRWLNPLMDSLPGSPAELLRNVAGFVGPWAAGMFGGIGRVVALLLLPLLAFYLLADSGQVRSSLLRFVPPDGRAEISGIANAIDRALRRYVRGQAIVSLTMGTAVGIALAVMNLPLVLLLAVIVAIAEVVPYLGFVLAAIAIGIAGLSVSPLMALSGVIAYVVINWLIGVFISPRVMGRYLEMHPFVVTVAVLAGTAILGPVGALLALPGTAALQAAMGEITPSAPSGEDESPCPPAPPGSGLDPGR